MTTKELAGEAFAIEKEDITHLVLRAWEDSFARIHTNKNAVADRGWNPLNYNCLLHREIIATHCGHAATDGTTIDNNNAVDHQSQSTTSRTSNVSFANLLLLAPAVIPPDLLNLSEGLAGTLMDSLMETRVRADARNGVNLEQNRLKRKETALEAIASKNKRYSAGLHVSAGQYSLGPQLVTKIRERHLREKTLESQRQENRLTAYRIQQDRVAKIRALGQPHSQLTVQQLKTMVMWYKQLSDLPIPATKQLLFARLNETCHRNEPLPPPLPCLVVPPHTTVVVQRELVEGEDAAADPVVEDTADPVVLQLPPELEHGADHSNGGEEV